jgi:biopolymer transport protein ExbB
VVAAGIATRRHGPEVMIEMMQAEGKRCGNGIWQRISFLNDIAAIAPMLGLLGTVLGLFFAFYDMNRSTESITVLFDGLGIAVGTTVAGLVVAIMSMVFYTSLKFRVVHLLNLVEAGTLSVIHVMAHDPVNMTPNSPVNPPRQLSQPVYAS